MYILYDLRWRCDEIDLVRSWYETDSKLCFVFRTNCLDLPLTFRIQVATLSVRGRCAQDSWQPFRWLSQLADIYLYVYVGKTSTDMFAIARNTNCVPQMTYCPSTAHGIWVVNFSVKWNWSFVRTRTVKYVCFCWKI